MDMIAKPVLPRVPFLSNNDKTPFLARTDNYHPLTTGTDTVNEMCNHRRENKHITVKTNTSP
jgi:hypothetical protein